MLDFLMVSTRSAKKGVVEIFPKFKIDKTNDLMIRGGDFYAIWDEKKGFWSTDEQDALRLIDEALDIYAQENASKFDGLVHVLHMWDSDTGMIDKWHKYCQKQMRDGYHMLDEKIIFSNEKPKKRDYVSKQLPYALEEGDHSAWDELVSTLYSEEEKTKIEWAIGAIVTGDSKKIQKFLVLYGAAGTGKSTVLNIIQQLFEGYYSVFDAKALGSNGNSFALEAFKTNPLVAIQHDGDLSHIEDNTRLNSLVSHELMTVNEKFKSTYTSRFKAFLFMGTNKPVKITDAKSGLLRRLIDVSPSGKKMPFAKYQKLYKEISFQLGAIAWHCREVYMANPERYDTYIPTNMLGASNDFYNFVEDNYYVFKKEENITLKQAWEMYKVYCEDTKILYPFSQRVFKEELKNYFWDFDERKLLDDGNRYRNVYSGFRADRFDNQAEKEQVSENYNIIFKKQKSIFDEVCADCSAQYANTSGTPNYKWENVETKLKDLDSSKLHYIKIPENHVVIDFDIPDEKGEKSYEKNLAEASKWPSTYAELSKSGKGIHLHYIYTGDPTKLSRIYDDHIEIKVFTGNSSLRRKLTKCNDIPINTISWLPLKGEDKVVNFESLKNEKHIRALIKKNLNKEIHPGTKPSIDFIYDILERAYESGMAYNVEDLRTSIFIFASNSTHQADYCKKMVKKMKFKSENETAENNEQFDVNEIIFYDVEVFPNLFLVNWKKEGDSKVVRMINPTPQEIEVLIKHKLIGFNCRRYDNHILYGRLLGYTNEQLYKLSQNIVNGLKTAFFSEAYNLSYADVYDFSSKKQSLKKFEIELDIHHQELGLPWDQPVPEELWAKVAEYCDNDVIATEAVFNARKADFTARQILSDVAGMTVNDTTNSLTTRIIFGSNRKPQPSFNYRDMGDTTGATKADLKWAISNDYIQFDKSNRPVFEGYKYDHGKSTYRGEEVGEGGYVYAEPGMYGNVALLDIASMHPSSIVAEQLFGEEYTRNFEDILQSRIAIKHKEFDRAKKMLGGKLAKYLDDEGKAADLAQALKIAINSVYGLTSASFENPFKDPRNIDNIVAKRGALFMINLKHAVQELGYTVAHIKTDSIKIPDATPEIIEFVQEFGRMYGYNFEHEATYERMCLVNDAVYIAKYDNGEWTATGTQFQVPYVFKTLFSKEPLEFSDFCETKSVTSALYLAEEGQDSKDYRFIGKVGLFCPMKKEFGGKTLYREKDGKFYAATGTKGYLWQEAEVVKTLGKEEGIDKSYYEKLANDAIEEISKYGDYEWFVSDDPYISPPFLGGKIRPIWIKK